MATQTNSKERISGREAATRKIDLAVGSQSILEYLEQRSRLFLSFWAETKQGKSYFTLTWPKPIFLFSFEPEGPYWAIKQALKEGMIKEGDVYVIEVIQEAFKEHNTLAPLIRTPAQNGMILTWFYNKIKEVVAAAPIGATIALDTGTTLNELLSDFELDKIFKIRENRTAAGKEVRLFPFDWRKPNTMWKNIVDSMRNNNTLNVVISHHAAEVWTTEPVSTTDKSYLHKPTPLVEYQGNKKTLQWVDVHGRLLYEPLFRDPKKISNEDKENGVTPARRWFEIERCRIDSSKEKTELENPSYDAFMELFSGVTST